MAPITLNIFCWISNFCMLRTFQNSNFKRFQESNFILKCVKKTQWNWTCKELLDHEIRKFINIIASSLIWKICSGCSEKIWRFLRNHEKSFEQSKCANRINRFNYKKTVQFVLSFLKNTYQCLGLKVKHTLISYQSNYSKESFSFHLWSCHIFHELFYHSEEQISMLQEKIH